MASMTSKPEMKMLNSLVCISYTDKHIAILHILYDIHEHILTGRMTTILTVLVPLSEVWLVEQLPL